MNLREVGGPKPIGPQHLLAPPSLMTLVWLPVTELKLGHLYRLDARRQALGVWNGKEFVGIQWEFGHPLLSYERHWDAMGTAKPLEDSGERTPAGVELTPGWTGCETCHRRTGHSAPSGMQGHLDPTDHHQPVEVWIPNQSLFDWLFQFEPPEDPIGAIGT